MYLSKIIQSKARLFTRNIRQPGAAFEYVLFLTSDKQKCVGIFQAGHLLEGPPGWDNTHSCNCLCANVNVNSGSDALTNIACDSRHVHGGAIATMIDTVTGTHVSMLSAPVVTANLNINYRRYRKTVFLLTCST